MRKVMAAALGAAGVGAALALYLGGRDRGAPEEADRTVVVGGARAAEQWLFARGAQWSQQVRGEGGEMIGVIGVRGYEVSGVLFRTPPGDERWKMQETVREAADELAAGLLRRAARHDGR